MLWDLNFIRNLCLNDFCGYVSNTHRTHRQNTECSKHTPCLRLHNDPNCIEIDNYVQSSKICLFERAFGSDFCGKLIKVKYYLNKSILLKKFSTLSHHAFHWWPVKWNITRVERFKIHNYLIIVFKVIWKDSPFIKH